MAIGNWLISRSVWNIDMSPASPHVCQMLYEYRTWSKYASRLTTDVAPA